MKETEHDRASFKAARLSKQKRPGEEFDVRIGAASVCHTHVLNT